MASRCGEIGLPGPTVVKGSWEAGIRYGFSFKIVKHV